MPELIHHTSDGVPLHVRAEGPDRAAATVVLTHGYAQASDCWHAQADALAAAGMRVVVWDLRGHGRSGRAPADSCTIDRVADDLAEIVAEHTRGPVVLVGHSMGGMALMALAERHPALVAERVAGVALVSTAADGDRLGFLGMGERGAHLAQAVGGWLFGQLARADWAWRLVRAAGPLLEVTLLVSCCGWHTSRDDVRLTGKMAGEAGFATMAAFLPSLQQHHRADSLARYAGLPALVLHGTADLVVPLADGAALARRLPRARRVRVPRAGHNVMMAAPALTSRELVDLAHRAVRSRPGAPGTTPPSSPR